MADAWEELARCTGFQWDEANATKNWERHQVSQGQCEQVFFNHPFVVAFDERHSQDEPRYYGLGQTDAGRHAFIVFTIRGDLIRVISARDMSRRERKVYERKKEGS